MCVVCPIVAGTFLLGAAVVKVLKKTVPPPTPEPLPVAVYGEDLED